MLTRHVNAYIAMRRAAGFQFRDAARRLQDFARFAMARSEAHVKTESAIEWAAKSISPHQREQRLRAVIRFARYARAENPKHEIPLSGVFVRRFTRRKLRVSEHGDHQNRNAPITKIGAGDHSEEATEGHEGKGERAFR